MTRNLFTSSKYNKILRHSFSKLSAEFDNSDKSLIEIHKSSYNNFLISANDGNASIKDVLNSIFPINDSYGYVSIEYIDYRLTEPLLSLDEAKIKSGTYGADLYITLRLILFTTDDTTGVRNIKAIKKRCLWKNVSARLRNDQSFGRQESSSRIIPRPRNEKPSPQSFFGLKLGNT